MLDGYGNKVIYDGCIACFRCNAIYSPGGEGRHWHLVSYCGTQPDPCYDHGRIPDEYCPICRKPPLRERPVEHYPCM